MCESGKGVGVYVRGVEGEKPDMTAEKQSRIQEEIEQRYKQLNFVLVSGEDF